MVNEDGILLTTFPCPECGKLIAGYRTDETKIRLTDASAAHFLDHMDETDAEWDNSPDWLG